MESDINTRYGANIPVFEILFEAYTKDYPNKDAVQTYNKKKILFLIRDFSGNKSLDEVTKTITQQFEETWNKFKFKHDSRDFFILEFATLEQKPSTEIKITKENLERLNLNKKIFEEEIEKLKDRFFNERNENYIFKNINEKDMINYKDFSDHAKSLW
eukprot:jgi/Orpsp1_1/1187637/evm.model.d7180000059157.1